MTTALALPEARDIGLDQVRDRLIPLARALRQEYREFGDIDGARELTRRLEAFQRLVGDRETRNLLAAEARRTEVLVGHLLGPAIEGRPLKETLVATNVSFQRWERFNFRQMAKYEPLVEQFLGEGVVSRNALLAKLPQSTNGRGARSDERGRMAMRVVCDQVDGEAGGATPFNSRELGAEVQIGHNYLDRAQSVRVHAPELIERVLSGEVTLNAAYEVAARRARPVAKLPQRTIAARREREERIRQMASDGYSEADIAAAVGLAANTVRNVMTQRLGLRTLGTKMGVRALEANHIVEGLVLGAGPSADAIAAINWDALDPTLLAGWEQRLGEAIQQWVTLRRKLRRTLSGRLD